MMQALHVIHHIHCLAEQMMKKTQ